MNSKQRTIKEKKMDDDKPRHKSGVETDYGCSIFDIPEENGIELHVPVGSETGNCYARIFMTDEQAEDLISIIQNKLNGRYKLM